MSTISFVVYILSFTGIISLLLSLHALLTRPSKPYPPGPKPWPIVGNLPQLGAAPHKSLTAMVQTYGPLIHLKLGVVHVIVVASSHAASQFLKTRDANFSSRPIDLATKELVYNGQGMSVLPYGPKWSMLRKICNVHLFSTKALNNFQHIRHEEVAVMASSMTRSGSMLVDIGQLINECIANVLGKVFLGKSLFGDDERTKGQRSEDFKKMVTEMQALSLEFSIGEIIPSLEWLDLQGVKAKMKKLFKKFDEFLSNMVEEHKISGNDGEENSSLFLSVLIDMKENNDNDEGKLTDTDIKALLMDLLIGGTDTTTSTTEWAISELIRNPKVLARVQEELDIVVGKDRLVAESDLGELPLLQAVIKETFRLHPAAPLSIPRTTTECCEIDGYTIPKDSTILVNLYAIGRDPNVWRDPLDFKPERFLPGTDKANIDVKGTDFDLIPFGAGRRICVGMSFGLEMVKLMTATLVHAYNFVLPEGQIGDQLNMEEESGLTLQRSMPLVVHPHPRLAPKLYTT